MKDEDFFENMSDFLEENGQELEEDGKEMVEDFFNSASGFFNDWIKIIGKYASQIQEKYSSCCKNEWIWRLR